MHFKNVKVRAFYMQIVIKINKIFIDLRLKIKDTKEIYKRRAVSFLTKAAIPEAELDAANLRHRDATKYTQKKITDFCRNIFFQRYIIFKKIIKVIYSNLQI